MEDETSNSHDEQLPNIPDYLILDDILPRLPIKSLVRFKSVSKSWLSTITSRKFVKSHLKFSAPSSQYLLFLRHNPSQQCHVVSYSCDEGSGVRELVNLEFTYNGGYEVHVVGSCNGLICLHDENYKFCLWNPATRDYHYIDRPDYRQQSQDFIAVGFGYVSSIDDYRIACLISFGRIAELKLYVYSLSAAKWEKMAGYSYDGRKIARGDALSVMINDTLYWPPAKHRDNENPVVGVNLVSGQFIKIALMMDYSASSTVKLFRMKGRLACSCCHGYKMYIFWMLKRDESGWMKLFEHFDRDSDLIYSTENGKSLILKDSHLMLLDPSQVFLGQFEQGTFFDVAELGDIANALEYRASLVSPACW